ncbi:PhoH family protein [Arhodomonas aquaeolei]|uniref:PhoH family protein n=1 Tax=Arhodomonas aquaeolei TaxID=2369 RepID=UPI00037288A7|nr:PhoH family protein [Arhodomonas aquaeolei]
MTASDQPRAYVLDTSVLMHDPAALFRFEEHDLYLPVVVLSELDDAKRGVSEEARNVRQVSRFLDTLLADAGPAELAEGLVLAQAAVGAAPAGRLFFLRDGTESGDEGILAAALALRERLAGHTVVLVSKDINLRIRATVAGLRAEDYHSDQVLDDVDLLYTGVRGLDEWPGEGGTAVAPSGEPPLAPRECVHTGEREAVVSTVDEAGRATLAPLKDYRAGGESVWGVHARNREQNFALNLLLDPAVDFVTLLGPAGTGKTLLALAAGLAQTFDDARYREIVMTRATVSIGEDIGHLPGTEEEKMTPWMGALMDNLEVLSGPDGGGWQQAATRDVLQSRIRIRSLNFMRGRTFIDRYLILDEAQNLTAKQMKTLITRAGPGTKVVCLGNIAQIDTPYLTGTTSGLTYVVDRFRGWPHAGHITLQRGERSRLADYASEML